MDELQTFLGDAAFTNVLLALNIVVVSRVFPYARELRRELGALCEHFKLTPHEGAR
jgi:hypothetical protein